MGEVAGELEGMLARPVAAMPAASSTDHEVVLTEQPSSRSKSGGQTLNDSRRSLPELADGQPVAVRGAVPLNPLSSSVGPVLPANQPDGPADPPGERGSQAGRRRGMVVVGGLLGVGALLTVAAVAVGGLLKPKKVRLRIDMQGEIGAGQVRSDPAGIDCGDLCSERFAKGTRVRLHATAAPGFAFAGWSGDCQGQEPCSLQLRWDLNVTARFARIEPTVSPTSPGSRPNPHEPRPQPAHSGKKRLR